MVSLEKEEIDFIRLEKELFEGIEKDKKYWRENDAKLRAVEQRVATYEEFTDIVKACHLKPFTKEDLKKKKLLEKKTDYFETQYENREFGSDVIPKTRQEFERSWKHLKDGKQRLNLLKKSKKLFPDFLCENLGELISTLIEAEDYIFIVDILERLCSTYRFNLCVQLLTNSEVNDLKNLFLTLENKMGEKFLIKIENLKAIYFEKIDIKDNHLECLAKPDSQ